MNNHSSKGIEMPLGLGMALAQNPTAMQAFSSLPQERQQQIIDHTHSVTSKKQMQAFVSAIERNPYGML